MPRAYREPEYRRRIRQQTEHDQNCADDERDRSAKSADIHEIVLAIKAIDEKYDRETHKEHTRKKWDRLWEVLGVVGLWLAAAVGISAIIYGTRDANEQRGIMQGQLNQMKSAAAQTARASRPYLLFEPVTMTFTPTAEQLAGFSIPGQVMPLMPGRHFVAIFKFTNYGTTPALIFNERHYLEFPEITKYSFTSFIETPFAEGYVIVAQKSTKNFHEPQTFSEVTWQNLIGGVGKLYLSSKVIYEDVFGNSYETMACFKIDVPFGSLTPREVGPNCSNKRT